MLALSEFEQKLLAFLKLTKVFRRFENRNSKIDWPNILSPGEAQRIATARLILRVVLLSEIKKQKQKSTERWSAPQFVIFVDEGTSHLDDDSEQRVY